MKRIRAFFLYRKAQILGKARNYQQAEQILDEAIALRPNYVKALHLRAIIRQKSDNNEEALTDLNQAISVDSQNAKLFADRGFVKGALDDIDSAYEDFQYAISNDKYLHSAYYGRAKINKIRENYNAALEDLGIAIQANAFWDTLYMERAEVRLALDDFDGAVEDYEIASRTSPDNTINHIYWVRMLIKYERDNEAELALNDLIEQFPDNKQAFHSWYGFMKFSQGDYEGALTAFEALNIDWEKPQQPYLASTDISLQPFIALTYLMTANYVEAVKHLTLLIDKNPEDTTMIHNRGFAYYQLENYEAALEDYSKVLQYRPNSANTHCGRGAIYFIRKSYRQAFSEYHKAFHINNKYPHAIAGLALCYFQFGELTKSVELWNSLVEIDKNYQTTATIQEHYNWQKPLLETAEKIIHLIQN